MYTLCIYNQNSYYISLAAVVVTITQLFTSNSIISLIVFAITYGSSAYFYPKAKDCQI
ncbi:hypothetical protein [Arcobacter sp. CECT 8989]|uniref:hypothetical protein n=1 Tax=Arcobacter sp. CECT 8989 TaxID=2044509 RepID=UPI0013E93FDF|nr:hypothetical protein [Arcobacter sp. CECT 8989]